MSPSKKPPAPTLAEGPGAQDARHAPRRFQERIPEPAEFRLQIAIIGVPKGHRIPPFFGEIGTGSASDRDQGRTGTTRSVDEIAQFDEIPSFSANQPRSHHRPALPAGPGPPTIPCPESHADLAVVVQIVVNRSAPIPRKKQDFPLVRRRIFRWNDRARWERCPTPGDRMCLPHGERPAER